MAANRSLFRRWSMAKKLDFSKFNFAEEPMSMADSLKGIAPLALESDVLEGKKKITVVSASKEKNSTCVKLEISS